MPLAERLGRLGRKRFHERVIAVRQIDNQVVRLAFDAVDHDEGFAEVRLCVARRMRQRHEHLLSAQLLLADVLFDATVAARETVLVAQAVKDALGGVPLLPGTFAIVAEDLIDDARERAQLRPPRRLAPLIARRRRVAQHLAHRFARQTKPSGRLALA